MTLDSTSESLSPEPVTAVAFSPSLDRLVSASGDGCIFVWQLPADVSRSMRSRQNELQTCESVASTPRERVSGAGVFAASPSPRKPVKAKKGAKPTISDLRKISLDADVSVESSRAKPDEHIIASQRSMLSALLDETLLKPKQCPDASVDASVAAAAGEEAARDQGQERLKAFSPVPAAQRGNWMLSPETEADGLPPLKRALAQAQPVGGRGGGGQGGHDQGDLVVSELECCDLGRQGVGGGGGASDFNSAVASTEASTVATANEELDMEDRPGYDDVVHEAGADEDRVLDFTVLTSEDVRSSRALEGSSMLNASSGVRTGNASGLGELESDMDDDLQGRIIRKF